MSFFFSFLSFSFKLRERERVYKIWYKEKQSQGYLSYFFDGVLWRIFLLIRANRLYAIFNTGLKNLVPSCPRYFFVFFTRSTGFWSVCHEPCPITNFLIIYFRWREGVPTSVLASLFFPLVRQHFRATRCHPSPILFPSGHPVQTSVFPFWPGFVTLVLTYILSCLNGHSLAACYY